MTTHPMSTMCHIIIIIIPPPKRARLRLMSLLLSSNESNVKKFFVKIYLEIFSLCSCIFFLGGIGKGSWRSTFFQ